MKKGFTLIEILIVVAIIALLATIVLVGVGTFRSKGRDAKRISDLNSVRNVLELYFTKYGNYPAANQWIGGDTSLSAFIIGASIGVSYLPNDPTSGWGYGYCAVNDASRYTVAAHMEDTSNPALTQNPSYPCAPAFGGTTPEPNVACSVTGAGTSKLCLTVE